MESSDEIEYWMGDYYALVGNHLLHSGSDDTQCKLALHLMSEGNHKDRSRMIFQYLETVVDAKVKKLLPDTATNNEKFRAMFFPAVALLYSELGKSFLNISTYNEFQ